MFGYVSADLSRLNEEQRKRYKSCYCGLCRTLKERHGALSRLTLTYDMSFLILFLSALYEPVEKQGEESCIAHPGKTHEYMQNEISEYAADMNMALAYLNCLDDWQDDRSLLALAEAELLKKSYERVREKYAAKCAVIEACLEELKEIENSRASLPDEASACFGRLMGELFAYNEDVWSPKLREFGMALGKFIYILDACIDLEGDAWFLRYNPMKELLGLPDEMERFRQILEMLLSSCVKSFEYLPIVRDADIIRNVLCFGVWQKFNKHYNVSKEGAVPDARPL